jgi:hypothetical protein
MFDFIDVEQNTEEWFKLRCGKLTSSKLPTIMANYGKPFGEPAKRYAKQLAVESITGNPTRSGYKNDHMIRGHEEEPIAKMAYESEMFLDVSNGGFFCSDFIGCSPDGLVGEDGLVEIKSAEANIHYDRVSKGSFDSSYKWQLLGNVKFTERDWIDFISYCSDFPDGKRLYIYRIIAKNFKEEFDMIDSRIEEFKTIVDEYKDKILNSHYFIGV